MVQYLLDHGADVNGHSQNQEDKIVGRPGVTPLCRAAYFNGIDAMELLLKHGATVNSAPGSESPLICAAVQGNLKAAQILVAHGVLPITRRSDRPFAFHQASVHPATFPCRPREIGVHHGAKLLDAQSSLNRTRVRRRAIGPARRARHTARALWSCRLGSHLY